MIYFHKASKAANTFTNTASFFFQIHHFFSRLLLAVTSAIINSVRFLKLNATVKDNRATRRHNWRWVLFILIDTLLAHRFHSTRPTNGTLVVLVNRLGDAIVSKPLINGLRNLFETPSDRFTVLGDLSWKVLSDNIYKDTDTFFIDERAFRLNLLYRLKVTYWLRRMNFSRAICFMHHRLEMRDDALVALSRADKKIVLDLPFFEYRWYPWIFDTYLSWMTDIIPTPKGAHMIEVFDPQRDAVRRVPHVFDRQMDFFSQLTNGRTLAWQRLSSKEKTSGPSPYVVLSFGASARERCWPLPLYVDLAARFTILDYHVMFVGGPAEEVYREQLLDLIAARTDIQTTKVTVLVNELPFDKIIHLYEKAACFVGTDTGGSHLAKWLGTPLVTILHADRRLEAYHRLGDFFPYPEKINIAPYRAVWTTLDEFNRTDDLGTLNRVWESVQSILSETNSLHNS